MVKVVCQRAGSNSPERAKRSSSPSSSRACTASASARAVATMPRPDLTNSGSPVMARSLSSRWLTADCVTPRRCAAPVMLPASTTATSSCSRRASRSDQSNLLMDRIMIDVFIFGNAGGTLQA